jgi:hypothetical protein
MTLTLVDGGETPDPEEPETCAHDYRREVTAPTCTDNGYTTYICNICGDSYVGDEVKAPGHSFTSQPTCDNCPEANPDYNKPEVTTKTITFNLGENGNAVHYDPQNSSDKYSETVDGYTLSITGGTNMYTGARDAKGNSCIKLGSSKKTGGFSFTVPDDVTSVVIYIAKYKSNASKVTVNGTTYTLSSASDNGAYDEITIDTTTTKTVTVSTVASNYRAMVNTIVFKVEE